MKKHNYLFVLMSLFISINFNVNAQDHEQENEAFRQAVNIELSKLELELNQEDYTIIHNDFRMRNTGAIHVYAAKINSPLTLSTLTIKNTGIFQRIEEKIRGARNKFIHFVTNEINPEWGGKAKHHFNTISSFLKKSMLGVKNILLSNATQEWQYKYNNTNDNHIYFSFNVIKIGTNEISRNLTNTDYPFTKEIFIPVINSINALVENNYGLDGLNRIDLNYFNLPVTNDPRVLINNAQALHAILNTEARTQLPIPTNMTSQRVVNIFNQFATVALTQSDEELMKHCLQLITMNDFLTSFSNVLYKNDINDNNMSVNSANANRYNFGNFAQLPRDVQNFIWIRHLANSNFDLEVLKNIVSVSKNTRNLVENYVLADRKMEDNLLQYFGFELRDSERNFVIPALYRMSEVAPLSFRNLFAPIY